MDPSGSYWAWKASAIGEKSVNAKTFLEKRYNAEMELEDAIHTVRLLACDEPCSLSSLSQVSSLACVAQAILTLKEGFEGEVNETNIEIGIVGEDRKFRVLSTAEVKDYVNEVQ